ncbi:hypothetical protein HK104_009658 [Borealophlyctis nickersoniae]|nr:hypothetical protein HK104_009658 [Borealophlyctis nickersoniae]
MLSPFTNFSSLALISLLLVSPSSALDACTAGPNSTCTSDGSTLKIKQGDYIIFRLSNPNNFTTLRTPYLYTATFWNNTPPAGFNPNRSSDPRTAATSCADVNYLGQPGYRCDDLHRNLKAGIRIFLQTDGAGKNRSENAAIPYLGFSTVPGNIIVSQNKHRYMVPTLNGTFPLPDYDSRTQYETPPESLPILTGNETYTVRWFAWTTDVSNAAEEFVLESATGEIVISANPLKQASALPLVLMSLPDGFVDNGGLSSSTAGMVTAWIVRGVVGLLSMYLII